MRKTITQELLQGLAVNSSIQKLEKIAKEHNGKCLSESNNRIKQKLLWECKKGHRWRTSVESILYSGSWCPECAGNRKLSLIELQHLARKKNGLCLASNYINSKTKLLWQCKNGHQWYATAFSIKTRDSWCPQCAKNVPYGIESMINLAKSRKGNCLSKEYINCKILMLWECNERHQFLLSSEKAKLGKWCPFCSKY